ncbi:YihY/virulence factor BrkB family protein [Prevotella brunnea]|uniref:YihY/virulence factor BrkB family protein n=1 Tax=Prevotella brunnea TaxID=2508867 RepID=A0A5C8GN68_9BACT|nr:YihY/virulence factor BrkB family protein [Prevotella brunnea]TXJ62246.1 YihY/virulence factor BrkB family protein [Prevotella brunnea]
MKINLARIKHFFKIGIWRKDNSLSPGKNFFIRLLQKLYLAIKFFFERGHIGYATQLSFSTILAIVPIASMIFAIANGFGFGKYMEEVCRDTFSGQPAVADWLIQLANSYLVHAKTGLFIGIGLIFMFYSIISLINTVEQVFDSIWQVKGSRPIGRILTDYTAMMFLVPIAIIIMSGLSIFIYGFADRLKDYWLLGSVATFSIRYVLPWMVISIIFIVLFIFMPNTKVKATKTLLPGMLAGAFMLVLQWIYIHGQIFLTSYNAIYGSLAALPLFMLWMQISWYICLFGAELCYTNQNLEFYEYLIDMKDVSHENRLIMSGIILSHICQRFSLGQHPYTALELKTVTKIPIRVTTEILHNLCNVNLIAENNSMDTTEITFSPTMDTNQITIGKMITLLESYPKDKYNYLNLDTAQIISPHTAKQFETIREDYLHKLNDISVKELIS